MSTDKSKEELQKEAQVLLSQARKLIDDAGKLAEQGNFTLYFGEIGTYIPKAMADISFWKDFTRKKFMAEGVLEYDNDTDGFKTISFDSFSKEEQDELVEQYADDWRRDELNRDFIEFDEPGGQWWHPSRC